MRQKIVNVLLFSLLSALFFPAVLCSEEKIEKITVGPGDRYYGEVEYMKRVTENGRLKRMEVYYTDSYIEENDVVYQFEHRNTEGRLYRLDYRFSDSFRDYWGIDLFYKYLDSNNNTQKCMYRFYDGTEVVFEGERLRTLFTYIPKKAFSHYQDYFYTDGRSDGEMLFLAEKEASTIVKFISRPVPIDGKEKAFLAEWLKTSEGRNFRASDFTLKVRADEDGEEVTFLVHSNIAGKIEKNKKSVVCFHYIGGVYPEKPLCIAVDVLDP